MSDKCVACGEVAEGKPLYKKLGSSDCSTDVFTALHEMQLISLPFIEKDNHYICWDCDETISEEYSTFIRTESKRKANEVKRKRQDEARNIKLKKKLKLAFKKVHEENLRASGITPPVSKYKMKEKEREENKYHSSHCILCKCSFEDNQGRGFQRFTLQKMVNDEHDVAQVLQKLNVQLDIDLSEEVKRKRFVCCQCYNKMRRNFKSKNKNELIEETNTILHSPQIDAINEQPGDVFKRRPTAEEHAAEIAKLIPPSLANLYKVVTKDKPSKNKGSKKHSHRTRHDNKSHKKSKKRKDNPPSSSSSASNTSEDSSVDSSSSSSSDSSDSSDSDSVPPIKGEKNWKNNTPNLRKDSTNRSEKNSNNSNSDFSNRNNSQKLSTKMLNTSGMPENNSEITLQNVNISKGFAGISASRNFSSSIPHNMFSDGPCVDSEVLKAGVCNICGMKFISQPTSFWHSLNSLMPSVAGVTVADALQILDSKLSSVNPGVRKKKLVCKPCYSRVCNGFRSQIIQRIAEKKGLSVDKIEASKLKVTMMEDSVNSSYEKVNGSCSNKLKDPTPSSDLVFKHNPDSHRKKKKKKDKQHSKKEFKSKCSNMFQDSSTVNALPKNNFFKLCRATLLNSPKYNHDMELLKLINKSRHLQYKGKVVKLYNVCVHLAELKEILPSSAFNMEPVRLELLNDVHIYSNFYRNLKNKIDWQICILCQQTKLGLDETSYWLDDPVAPPNLMVPLRWAHLTLVSPNSQSRAEIAIENGKVCFSCHQTLKEKFGKFVGSKVAVSHGLSSENIVLDKYKVSFDSKAMNIIADPLEKGVTVQEVRKKHKIGPKSKQMLFKQDNSKNKLLPIADGTDTKHDSDLNSVVLKESDNLSKIIDMPTCSSMDNVSLGLPLSETSGLGDKLSKINDMSVCTSIDNVSLDLALSETSGSEDEVGLPISKTEKERIETNKEILNKSVLNSPPVISEQKKSNGEPEINLSNDKSKVIDIKDLSEFDNVLNEASYENQSVEISGQTSNVDLVRPNINECVATDELNSQPAKLVIAQTQLNCLDADHSINVQTTNKTPETENKEDPFEVVPKLATVVSLERSENASLENASLEFTKAQDTIYNLKNDNNVSKVSTNDLDCLTECHDTSNFNNATLDNSSACIVAKVNITDNIEPESDDCPLKSKNITESHSALISDHKSSNSEETKERTIENISKESADVLNIPSPESSNVSESGCDMNNLIEDEIVNDKSFDDIKEVGNSKDNNETEINICDPADACDKPLVSEKDRGEQKRDEVSSRPHTGNVTESEPLRLIENPDNLNENRFETLRETTNEKDVTCVNSKEFEGNEICKLKDDLYDKSKLDLVLNSETNTVGEIETNHVNIKISELTAEDMENSDVATLNINDQLELKINERNAVENAVTAKGMENNDVVTVNTNNHLELKIGESDALVKTMAAKVLENSDVVTVNTNIQLELKIDESNALVKAMTAEGMENDDVAPIMMNTQPELKFDERIAIEKTHKADTNNPDQLNNIDNKNISIDIQKELSNQNTPVKEISVPSTHFELETEDNTNAMIEKISESETLIKEIKNKNGNIRNIIDYKTNKTINLQEKAEDSNIIEMGKNIEYTTQKEIASEVKNINEQQVKESLGKNSSETAEILCNQNKDNKSPGNAPNESVARSSNLEKIDIDNSKNVEDLSKSINSNLRETSNFKLLRNVGETVTNILEKANKTDVTSSKNVGVESASKTEEKIDTNMGSKTRTLNQVINSNSNEVEFSGSIFGTKGVIEQAIEETSKESVKSSFNKETLGSGLVSEEQPQTVSSVSNMTSCASQSSKVPVLEEQNEIGTELNIREPIVESSGKDKVSNQNKNVSVRRPLKLTRSSARKRKCNTHITNSKCLSDLIDKENANSVNVITDYLNAQREKIRELIGPISSEEIHNNAMTCVETVSENLIKINSKLEKAQTRAGSPSCNISSRENLDKSISKKQASSCSSPFDNEMLHCRTTFESDDMQDLGSLSLGLDHQVEEMGEDTIAPFAQRKKCRRPPTIISDGELGNGSSDKEISPEEATAACVGNIWQSIQGISVDDLLTKEDPQPLKLSQYNVGVALALNDLRVLIGASLEDLLSWLKKLRPLEFAEKELEPCIEKFSSYLFSLNRSNEVVEPIKLKEPLSEDLFISCFKEANEVEEIKINECFIEDVMDESFAPIESKIQWDDYLAPVNMDNLLKGKESRVTWSQFNNGLLYALWKVNKLLHGDEDNFVRWLSLTSTTPMRASDYTAMSKAVTALDNHLQMFPEEISKLVAPIVIKSQSSKKDVSGLNKDTPKDNETPKTLKRNEEGDGALDKSSSRDNSPQKDIIFLQTTNNNSSASKRTGEHFQYPPSKKTARVRPQPSNEALVERTSARRRQSLSAKHGNQGGLLKVLDTEAINLRSFRTTQENKDIHPPMSSVTMADCINNRNFINLGIDYEETSSTRENNHKNIVIDGGKRGRKVWNSAQRIDSRTADNCKTLKTIDADPLIVNNSSVEGLPIITNVSGGDSSHNSTTCNLQPGNREKEDQNVNINIRNQNINISSLSSQLVSESLNAQFQQALINQAQFNLSNNVGTQNVQNFNPTGVPMIPVMSPSGFVTMVPLTVRRMPNLASTSAGGSSPFAAPESISNSSFMQAISQHEDNPKEKELESKVNVLEQQLLEIQKQNNQLFELNKKLLEKASTADDPKSKQNVTLNESSPPKTNDLPLPSPNSESSKVGFVKRGRPPKMFAKKLKPSFEEALQYNYKPKK